MTSYQPGDIVTVVYYGHKTTRIIDKVANLSLGKRIEFKKDYRRYAMDIDKEQYKLSDN